MSNSCSMLGKRGIEDGDETPSSKRTTTPSEISSSDADITSVEDTENVDKLERIATAMRTILECLGENPDREGLADTPMRAAKALTYFCSGYKKTPAEVVGTGVFDEATDSNIVVVKNIDIYSLCEHHMVPFLGKVHIAYQPNKTLLGLSKLARIADVFARRLQVQERLTAEIAEAVMASAEALGVAVLIDARHLCMAMRGVEKSHASTVTTCFVGSFESNSELKADFFRMLSVPSS